MPRKRQGKSNANHACNDSEPIFSLVAPHSECADFPQDNYRRIVEAAVFYLLGRPSFFSALVELVLSRTALGVGQQGRPEEVPKDEIHRIIVFEARRLASGIEEKFVETGRLELLGEVCQRQG